VGHKKYLSVKFDNFLIENKIIFNLSMEKDISYQFSSFMNIYFIISKDYQFINSLENKIIKN